MPLFFNINDKFKNTQIIFYNTDINDSYIDYYDLYTVFRDKNFNVSSINFFAYKTTKKEKKFGVLSVNKSKQIESELLKLNNKYRFKTEPYFLIGKIIKRQEHPKSAKLYVLQVLFGKDNIKQIITNTTYTTENKYFVWCMPGSITSKGIKIHNGKILDIDSAGMLCTTESLDLDLQQSQLMNELLNKCDDSFLGKDIFKVLKL
ncbi:TyrS-associated PheT N-terminal domain-related protein TapR [Mycoplasmopsis primatum]|uniref:TyrS-associated PheT N-terminal domain-related protein TapR n=1 Tax=Mycoplasmopsis primatum TaxID=55604 RepID=UPI000494DB8C|nr:tRNA-binding protein [Mycoplasmopsis primatum]